MSPRPQIEHIRKPQLLAAAADVNTKMSLMPALESVVPPKVAEVPANWPAT